ncbi:MAG: hypothetical protein N3B10_04805 [Armatimonadetes bacterium]|nr:hypothetical protein [Armatimonadota bacterium]MCX7967796.1 hypothetical protein [Armatimonadota bacterium]MDW8144217.1 hypothetical protein [Armatimonadota bacterium]
MKRSSIGFVIFLVIAVGAIYGISRLTSRLNQPESSTPPVQGETAEFQKTNAEGQGLMPTPAGNVKGSPEAKVKVVAVLPPSSCQVPTLRILDEIAKAEPKRVRVEIYGMGSPKGQQVLQQYGATCASVFINGKTEFTLTSEGQTRQVICQKSPGMSYQSTDLIEIVHMELKRLYGEGFSEKTLKELREKGRQIVGGGHGVSGMGSTKAKVVVEVLSPSQMGTLYPLFAQTVKVLEQLKEKYGDELSISVYPVMTAEGQKRMGELKLNGPAVVINGKTVHEIPGPNKTKRKIVTAIGTSGSLFSPKDITEIVAAYMKQAAKK